MERVFVFIDGRGFYFALKRNNRVARVDYHQLSLALAGPDRRLVRTYYYDAACDKNASSDRAKNQMSFLDSMVRTFYLELRLGRLVPISDRNVMERGTGVLFASDLVYHAARKAFDTAIVVTEDGDYSMVLERVKALGRHVEAASFNDGQSRELNRVADVQIPLDLVLDKYSSRIFPPGGEDDRRSMTDRVGGVSKSSAK